MENQKFKLLIHGMDTVQCAYYLQRTGTGCIDFQDLTEKKESIRHSKKRDPLPIDLGNSDFLLYPYGSSSGYPIIISNPDFKVEMGEFNVPNFFVTFPSEALWRESAYILHQKFLEWADSVGYVPCRTESLSRIDYCFDYKLPCIDFDEDSFVSYATKDRKYREGRTAQTFAFGKGDIYLRVYDKTAEIHQQSDKVWFYKLWDENDDVWRIEWQVRKPVLKEFRIFTFQDLYEKQGALLHYMAYEHDTLRQKGEDSNRSRWPLHPLWVDLQQKIDELNQLPAYRISGGSEILEERLRRIEIAIFGYLKRAAAIYCIQRGVERTRLDETMKNITEGINRIYDPLVWKSDVEKRRKEMLLGKW